MNKKIYFNNQYILITAQFQQTDNQDIVLNLTDSPAELSKSLNAFLQQNTKNNLILVAKNVNEAFERLKHEFVFIEAAGGVISNNGKYLLILRLGKWDLPKGKLDRGETPVKAAVRECEEECAVSGLSIINELPSSYHIYPYKGRMALKVTYWYRMQTSYSGQLVPQTEEKIEKAEWMDPAAITTTVFGNTYPAIIEVLKEALRVI